jgi:hypothetical protein
VIESIANFLRALVRFADAVMTAKSLYDLWQTFLTKVRAFFGIEAAKEIAKEVDEDDDNVVILKFVSA